MMKRLCLSLLYLALLAGRSNPAAAAGMLLTAYKDENDGGNTSKTTYECSVEAEDNPIEARLPADGERPRRRQGRKVHLPGADFVKTQNATLQDPDYFYGPACVFLNCATDLHPDGSDLVPTVGK